VLERVSNTAYCLPLTAYSKRMAEKLLVGVASNGATVARWRGSRLADCHVFGADAAGHASFKEYLEAVPNVPAYIMVDAVEEDYRFETLPHAYGSDRVQMAGRKLRQHYRNTPYMTAWRLGRDTGKRRDDRYLFSALTNPEIVADWLQTIIARGLPVAGIYLLPLVSADLPDKLGVQSPNLLIVAQHSAGLRLTFFRDKQFRLSRLTRGESGRTENRIRHFTEEISNTRLYLHALRTLTLDEPLTVLLLDRTDELVQVTQGIARETPSLECIRLGRHDLAAKLRIAEPLLESSPYVIYLQLLGLKAPQSNLAPDTATVGFRRHRARQLVYAACAVAAAAGFLWVGASLYQLHTVNGETEDAARQTAQLAASYQEATRRFPAAPASAENLRKTVEIAQKLRETARSPEMLMGVVSRALEQSPTIAMTQFGWKYGTSEIGADRAGPSNPQKSAPQTGPTGPALFRRQTALIDGEIRPFRGDYRAAIAAINDFAGRLGKEPTVAEVRVVKLPLNVNPSLSLSGNTRDTPDPSTTAEFKVLLVLKPNV
jgi:hypothetical protein